ncbi:CopG family antitoxin [Bdellovibrio sp. HCB209]|uniref:CopG family antitoxin n=1 Tax=Bdellovibrio sp. HCB209 TaxID=3394354 RepID=UPI0039B55BB9
MKKNSRAKSAKPMKVNDPIERDFSALLKSGSWKPMDHYFQFAPKDKTLTLRISSELLEGYKRLASKEDKKYQKLMREALIEYLAKKVS